MLGNTNKLGTIRNNIRRYTQQCVALTSKQKKGDNFCFPFVFHMELSAKIFRGIPLLTLNSNFFYAMSVGRKLISQRPLVEISEWNSKNDFLLYVERCEQLFSLLHPRAMRMHNSVLSTIGLHGGMVRCTFNSAWLINENTRTTEQSIRLLKGKE